MKNINTKRPKMNLKLFTPIILVSGITVSVLMGCSTAHHTTEQTNAIQIKMENTMTNIINNDSANINYGITSTR